MKRRNEQMKKQRKEETMEGRKEGKKNEHEKQKRCSSLFVFMYTGGSKIFCIA
jgi:hypothetical protein